MVKLEKEELEEELVSSSKLRNSPSVVRWGRGLTRLSSRSNTSSSLRTYRIDRWIEARLILWPLLRRTRPLRCPRLCLPLFFALLSRLCFFLPDIQDDRILDLASQKRWPGCPRYPLFLPKPPCFGFPPSSGSYSPSQKLHHWHFPILHSPLHL